MVAKQNLTVYQGADYRKALEFRNEAGVLLDLTGYTFRGQARLAYSDATPSLTFTFTLRDQVTNPGLVDMIIPAASTTATNVTKETTYIYDIEMLGADSIVRRVLEGKLKLYPEVTK